MNRPRMRHFFDWRYRRLLNKFHSRNIDKGIALLFSNSAGHPEPVLAWARSYARLQRQLAKWKKLPLPDDPHFLCDEGLGGLARWLRASGYPATWQTGIPDPQIIKLAREKNYILLTNDTLMMERGILRDEVVPAVWLPPILTIEQQLALIFEELDLHLRPARCMKCGGQLIQRPKESLAHRIPPKTYRWIDEYYVCVSCNHLFWKGTHRQRITHELTKLI